MELVDWDLAAATARRLVRPGPALGLEETVAVVGELRTLADEALGHVVGYTGLEPDPALVVANVVVDRGDWAAGNVAGMRVTLAPVLASLAAKRDAKKGAGSSAQAWATQAGSKVTAVELGGLLSFLAGKVLGQYETFLPPEAGAGRLSLVAPNIVDVERRLEVDPHDFRLWVALHEQTHRLQFTATPWLHDHLAGLVAQLTDALDLDPKELVGRIKAALGERKRGTADDTLGPLSMLQTAEQRAVTAQIQAVMTLLEGHADQVMDAVGPQVVPSVEVIRERFEQRRRSTGSPLDRVLRRVLGLDAKMAQYRIGGAFCRDVVERGGPAAMRLAFAAPENIPSAAEFTDAPAWLARVGAAA